MTKAIIVGVMEIWVIIRERDSYAKIWPVLLSGALYIIFGIALLFAPLIGAVVMVIVGGVLAILFGAGLLAMAWSTGLLLMLAQEFQDQALRGARARVPKAPGAAGDADSRSDG